MAEPATPSSARLLAIIEMQNAIAAAALNSDEVMRVVTERAAQLIDGSAFVELVEGDDVVCRASAGGASQQLGVRRSSKGAGLSGACIESRRPQRSPESAQVCVPLLHGEYAVGVLCATAPGSGALTDADVETLRLLATIIAIPLHRTRSFPRPRYDNTHDALTGLLNRRAFDERVNVELARRNRYKQTFSLALLDLDGFNTANDRFGEAAGDDLLKMIGSILSKHTRVMDACFRLGGDEFAILMPGTGLDGAKILAERFRTQIADARLLEGTVTASVGVVEAHEESIESLAERADAALRADKSARRS